MISLRMDDGAMRHDGSRRNLRQRRVMKVALPRNHFVMGAPR